MKSDELKNTAQSLIQYINITMLICNDNIRELKRTCKLSYTEYLSMMGNQPEAIAISKERSKEKKKAAAEFEARKKEKEKLKAEGDSEKQQPKSKGKR
jgi:hypothetical protein